MGQKTKYKVQKFRVFNVHDIEEKEKFYVNDTVRFEVQIMEKVDEGWLPLLSFDGFNAELTRVETFYRKKMTSTGRFLNIISLQVLLFRFWPVLRRY